MAALPPERLDLGESVLRRLTVADAAAVARAVADNLEHLRPWMPWAGAESADERFQRRRLAEADAQWARGADFGYGLFANGESGEGGCSAPSGLTARRAEDARDRLLAVRRRDRARPRDTRRRGAHRHRRDSNPTSNACSSTATRRTTRAPRSRAASATASTGSSRCPPRPPPRPVARSSSCCAPTSGARSARRTPTERLAGRRAHRADREAAERRRLVGSGFLRQPSTRSPMMLRCTWSVPP